MNEHLWIQSSTSSVLYQIQEANRAKPRRLHYTTSQNNRAITMSKPRSDNHIDCSAHEKDYDEPRGLRWMAWLGATAGPWYSRRSPSAFLMGNGMEALVSQGGLYQCASKPQGWDWAEWGGLGLGGAEWEGMGLVGKIRLWYAEVELLVGEVAILELSSDLTDNLEAIRRGALCGQIFRH